MLLVLDLPLIGVWVRLLSIKPKVLYRSNLLLVCLAVHSVNNSVFDVLITMGFGIVGFGLGRFSYPMASFVLGFILAPLLEEHFRRALLLSNGDLTVFFRSSISLFFMALIALIMVSTFWKA